MKDDIKLPPLPEGDIYADTCPAIKVHTDQQLQDYARLAIKADRNRKSEPEGWQLVPKELIDFLDAKEHHLPVEDRHVLSIMLAAAPKFGEEE